MTAKLSISVPDDVAAWLAQQANASAAVTDVVRAHLRAARTDEVLRAAGFDITDAGKRRWRDQLHRPIPADAIAEGRRLLERPAGPGEARG